jgi:hypothetical protein
MAAAGDSAEQKEFAKACYDGDLATVDRLIDHISVDPTAVSRRQDEKFKHYRSRSLLAWACVGGHLSVVQRLLQDARVDPAAHDSRAIRYASQGGSVDVVKVLLQDARVDPAALDNQAIRDASHRGKVDVVKVLLQDVRVDPAADDNQAIRYASQWGQLDVVEQLLQDARVNPAADDNQSIRVAWFSGNFNIVGLLLLDDRVDPAALHQHSLAKACTLTDAMLPRLAATLTLPFPDSSPILHWQSPLREYRTEQIQFLESLIASWRWHGGALCRDIVENIVSEYALGGLKLRQYRALDAEYVMPGPTAAEMDAVQVELYDVWEALTTSDAALVASNAAVAASDAALLHCQQALAAALDRRACCCLQ